MSKNFLIGGIILIVLIIGGAFFYASNNKTQKTATKISETEVENTIAGKTSPYLIFNQQDYDKSVAQGKLIILNFYANWCPICRAESPVWIETFNELDNENIIGFRVNFNDPDTDSNEKNLAQKFGVTYQHTKVFIRNGNEVLKVTEQWDKENLMNEINKYSN